MSATNLFKSFILPVLCNLVNEIKSIYILPPFSDSCTPLYTTFLPHMASASSVEVNLTVNLSHRNDLTDMML